MTKPVHIIVMTLPIFIELDPDAQQGDQVAADLCTGVRLTLRDIAHGCAICMACSAPITRRHRLRPVIVCDTARQLWHGAICADCNRDRTGLAARATEENLFRCFALDHAQEVGTIPMVEPGHA
jgi:hypothetical protein